MQFNPNVNYFSRPGCTNSARSYSIDQSRPVCQTAGIFFTETGKLISKSIVASQMIVLFESTVWSKLQYVWWQILDGTNRNLLIRLGHCFVPLCSKSPYSLGLLIMPPHSKHFKAHTHKHTHTHTLDRLNDVFIKLITLLHLLTHRKSCAQCVTGRSDDLNEISIKGRRCLDPFQSDRVKERDRERTFRKSVRNKFSPRSR